MTSAYCPDELSDTATFCAHDNVPPGQAANTTVRKLPAVALVEGLATPREGAQ